MGRELKRVPMDFNHPIREVWKGFINPFQVDCEENCEGGYSKSYIALKRYFYRYPMSKEMKEDKLFLTLLDLMPERIKNDPHRGAYHDIWRLFNDLAEKAGLDKSWNMCPVCEGEGVHKEYKEKYENWVKEEPPIGEGYQLWENTTEGSPKSPVFKTLEELCEWCEKYATTFADFKATKEEWMNMLSNNRVHHKSGEVTFI